MEAKLNPLFETAVAEKRVPGIGATVVDRTGNLFYHQTFGTKNVNNMNDDDAASNFDADTIVPVFSVTKLFTSIAALQLIEQGKLALDDLVETYVPRIAEIQVLVRCSDDGEPAVLRKAKSKPTILDLLTHTAGFTYDSFDEPTMRWKQRAGIPEATYYVRGEWTDFATPYTADPGTRYTYGINTDYLGFVVEAVSKLRLPEYIHKYILEPLDIHHRTGPYSSEEEKKKNMLAIHIKQDDQNLVAYPGLHLAESPPHWGGGGFLHTTMNDLAKLLSTILNYGTTSPDHPDRQILQPATIQRYLFTDCLKAAADKTRLGEFDDSASPSMTNAATLLPTCNRRGFSCGLLMNLEPLPFGRSAGSGMWCGAGNSYYWIDPVADRAGLVITNLYPFLDESVLRLFDQLERATYGHELGEDQANYAMR